MSLAALCASALVMLTVPAGAITGTTPTACENGCNVGAETLVQPTTTGAGQEDGTSVTVNTAGYINQVCYPVDVADGDLGTDPVNLWVNGVVHAGGGVSGGCGNFSNVPVTTGDSIQGTYEPSGLRFADTPDPGSSSAGNMTYVGGVYGASGSDPGNTGYGFGVRIQFWSLPVAPNATLTPTNSTTASFSFQGDSVTPNTYGESEPWTCSATQGTVTPSSGTGVPGPNTVSLTGLTSSPTNQITCNVHEVYGASVGPTTTVSTFLPPPTPAITSIVPASPTSLNVFVTPIPGATLTVTCTPAGTAAGTVGVGTGTTSPILVPGLTTDTPYNCVVTADFGNGGGISSSGPVLGLAPSVSGPGCAPNSDPAAPTQLSTASEAFPGAVVSWAPVDVDPSSCLVGYLVTPSDASLVPTLVLGHGTTTVIRGLTEGSSYTFTVAAVTGSGVGPQSDPTPSVTIGAPATASSVHATHALKGAIKVTFKPGRNNGAAITSTRATCKSSNGGVTRSWVRSSGSITVSRLTPGKTYTCSVTATNSRGTTTSRRSNAAKA